MRFIANKRRFSLKRCKDRFLCVGMLKANFDKGLKKRLKKSKARKQSQKIKNALNFFSLQLVQYFMKYFMINFSKFVHGLTHIEASHVQLPHIVMTNFVYWCTNSHKILLHLPSFLELHPQPSNYATSMVNNKKNKKEYL